MVIETYQNFKWWQKILFYIGLIQIISLWFWIFVLLFRTFNKKYRNKPLKEASTKLLYYFGYFDTLLLFIGILAYFGLITLKNVGSN